MSILTRLVKSSRSNAQKLTSRRHLFSFAGPKTLNEVMIMNSDLLAKNKAEISDIWMTYHEDKERVDGSIVSGEEGKLILERAAKM